jgi:hypothetical protein
LVLSSSDPLVDLALRSKILTLQHFWGVQRVSVAQVAPIQQMELAQRLHLLIASDVSE